MADKPSQPDLDALVARVAERLGIAAPQPRRRKGRAVLVTLQPDELAAIDRAAKAVGENRSHYMRQAALQRARESK